MAPVLGVGLDQLRPIDRIGGVRAPVLVASGTVDAYTPIAKARDLFARASAPKQFWAVRGAAHVDLEAYDAPAYWIRILPFFAAHLQTR